MRQYFDEVFKIMDESFPDDEMRTYEGQLALLDKEGYKLIVEKDKNNKVIAFMTVWEIEEFSFIEHLAIAAAYRGKGIGSKFLKQYMNECGRIVILEAEPAEKSNIAKRRISFYERLGFKFNDYYYEQPALRENTEKCELKIMSYPNKLNKKTFEQYKDIIYKKIYNVK